MPASPCCEHIDHPNRDGAAGALRNTEARWTISIAPYPLRDGKRLYDFIPIRAIGLELPALQNQRRVQHVPVQANETRLLYIDHAKSVALPISRNASV
jgi:hypothetical protein